MATQDDKSVKKAALLRLSDTDLKVADSTEDIRGRKVVDKDGKEIGDVDDLMIDDFERKVRSCIWNLFF
jgi:sporulation protein YlmC with PRC-barrel domain